MHNFILHIVSQLPLDVFEATPENIPTFLQQKLKNEESGSFNLNNVEKQTIIRALNNFEARGYSKSRIAQELGIGSATLYRKLKQYDIRTNILYE